ncbi:MAG: adenylyl-sulfate kinase [Sporichthyaceae bacterium]|nr:adenylyl-sulfate kinase [Sporichthyaceae bacterium]
MPAVSDLPESGLDLDPDELDDLDLVLRGALDSPILTLDRDGSAPADLAIGSELTLRDAEDAPVAKLAVTALIALDDHRFRIIGEATELPAGGHRRFGMLPTTPAEVAAQLATVAGPVLAVPVTGPPNAADLGTMRTAAARLGIEPAKLLLLVQTREKALGSYPAPRLVQQTVRSVKKAGLAPIVVPLPLPIAPDAGTRAYSWAQVAARYGASHLLLPPEDIAAVDSAGLATILLPGQLTGVADPDAGRRGMTVFFTGLSGSGKSTVAKGLRDRLVADGWTVSLLDGDEVRRLLSAGLGFSKADRDLNIRRIGYVAAEVTRHGGIAICAPIAPYAATRAKVRKMIAKHGDFLLIHVDTPLEVCESRDRKGLYAKARDGSIPEFTGISDPYESPDDAELRIDTSIGTVDDAVEQVHAMVRERLKI